jgi:hypothetical protein
MKVCACCFSDEDIKQFIISSSLGKAVCPYCGKYSEQINIAELLDFFADFIAIFFRDEKGIPLMDRIQRDWNLFSTDTNYQKILSEILPLLKSSLTALSSVSYTPEIKDCIEYWDILKEELKWNNRFLTDVEPLLDRQWDTLFNIYSTIDKNRYLYRARIHADGNKIPFGFDAMGSPPKEQTVGGRTNPQGIPYLYLCNDIETTFYETRVSYLDVVSIGTFQLKGIDEIKIVDFTQCESPFSTDIKMGNSVKGKLLRQLISRDLSKPMRRFDSELEYIPTQFICEFIRIITGAQGIQFNSSLHKNGVNVVLFFPETVQCVAERIHQVTAINVKSEIPLL